MKLAEALKEKNRLRKEITGLREKLEKSLPAEETPKEMLLKLEDSLRHLRYLSAAIFHTGDLITVDGRTMTQLIYTRDTLYFQLDLYRTLIRLAEKAENPSPGDLDLSELTAKAERVKEEMRSLNELIEKTNWTEELAE